jgi:hypothetical protein
MSASLTGKCPSCGKEFANDSLVLRHMNNPRTSCMSWSAFFESTPSNRPPNAHTIPSPRADDDETANDNDIINNDGTNNNSGDTVDPCTPTVTHYQDIHPNTPLVFGSGPGFMEEFNTGPHAEKRSENIYHPFSSKEEWGLASWLLCSGLSMRAMNDLLALPIVSHVECMLSSLLTKKQDPTAFTLFHKCKNTACLYGPSPQGSRMEDARRCSQRVRNRETGYTILPRSSGMHPSSPPQPGL